MKRLLPRRTRALAALAIAVGAALATLSLPASSAAAPGPQELPAGIKYVATVLNVKGNGDSVYVGLRVDCKAWKGKEITVSVTQVVNDVQTGGEKKLTIQCPAEATEIELWVLVPVDKGRPRFQEGAGIVTINGLNGFPVDIVTQAPAPE